jgi:hypothetical protein
MGKDKKEYITTRLVESKSKKAFKESAEKAMESNGYVIIAFEGWIVKKTADGAIEKLRPIDRSADNLQLVLD